MDAPSPPTTSAQAAPGPRREKPASRRLRKWFWVVGIGLVALAAGGVLFLALPAWLEPATLSSVEAAIEAKRFDAAVRQAERLRRAQGDDPAVLFALARAKAGADDLAGSVEALADIPAWSVRKPDAQFFAGTLLLRLHRAREAEAAFRACLATGGGTASPLTLNARVEILALCAMEERREAFKDLFWETFPLLADADRMLLLTMRMRLEFEQVKPELNAQTLRKYVAADPKDANALAGLAAALVHAGGIDEARSLYAKALDLAPEDPELRERYLDVLQRSGDLAAVRKVLAERPATAEGRPATWKFLGIVAQADGNPAAAEAAFARAVEADPFEPEYRHRLAQVQFLLGKKAEGEAQAAERARLDAAKAALHAAWNELASAFEADPQSVKVAQILGMARACEAAGLAREAAAWEHEARTRQVAR